MDHVYITGRVDADGSLALGWWSTPPLEAVASTPVHLGSRIDWEAVALDDADHVLARAPASLIEVPICPGGSRLELSALLAVPDITSAVAILDGEREVIRRAVPKPARVILEKRLDTILSRQLVEVPIRIDGPEPGSGAYIVPVWEAPNHPMLPLGFIDVGAGEPAVVRLDLTELPGGEGCRLWVTYCDGIRTTTTFSEPLSIEPRRALPVIVTPTPGMELFDDTWLSLEGRLEGDGDAGALEWLLDEELIATGARAGIAAPGTGTRTVTLRYGTARTSIEIVVHSAPTEEMRTPPWVPPWRSRPFRSMSSVYLGARGSETTK